MSFFISKKIDNSSLKIEWTIFPEDFRIAAYLYLWFSCLVGLYLTKTFGYPNVFEENAIKSIWGYNNLCVVFDYPPATYVFPTLWAFNLLLFVSYVATNWFRTYLQYFADRGIKKFYSISTVIAIIEISGFCYASTIFSVSPEDNLILHSLPFTTMVAILSLVAFRNGFYYFYETGLSSLDAKLAQLYLLIHLILSILYIASLLNGLFGDLFYNSMQNISYNGIIGRTWFVTGMVLPIYFGFKFRKRAKSVVLTSSFESFQ